MKAFLSLSAGILSVVVVGTCFGASLSPGKCSNNPKDYSDKNIATRIITNYNDSGQTACFSRNLNNRNVRVVYDVYAAGNDANNSTHPIACLRCMSLKINCFSVTSIATHIKYSATW